MKATQRNQCQYCVVQHERVSDMLGIAEEKIADIDGDKYKTSPHFTEGEKALMDLTVGADRRGCEPGFGGIVGAPACQLDRTADSRCGFCYH